MEMAFYQRNTVTVARMTAYIGGPNENKTKQQKQQTLYNDNRNNRNENKNRKISISTVLLRILSGIFPCLKHCWQFPCQSLSILQFQ